MATTEIQLEHIADTQPRLLDFLTNPAVKAPHFRIRIDLDERGKKKPIGISKPHIGLGKPWDKVEYEEALTVSPPMHAQHLNINLAQAMPDDDDCLVVIDIDHPDALQLVAERFFHTTPKHLLEFFPHTLSSTKKLPHLWVTIDPNDLPGDLPRDKVPLIFDGSKTAADGESYGEILFRNTYERLDAVMLGDLDATNLPWVNVDRIEPDSWPKPAPTPAPTPVASPVPAAAAPALAPSDTNDAVEHARNVSGAQVDERGQWITFIASCASCGVPQSVCLEVSARNSKHRPEPDAKTVDGIYSQGSWRAGMGTLCRLSKLSDPENFYRLQSKHFWGPDVEASLIDCEFSDTSYARSFLQLSAHTVGWTRMGELTCYDDETGLWCLGKKAEAMIRNQICDTLQRLLRHKLVHVTDKDKAEEILKRVSKIGQQTKRKALFECVRDLAYQQCAQFDIDRHHGTERWFAFKDCIYDADTGERMPYHPEAYISQKLHYDCPATEPEKTAQLRQVMCQIYPDDSERDLMLACQAQALTGDTSWEMHVNANGKSSAGKSLVVKDLGGEAFSTYHAVWPDDIFSQNFGRRKKYFTSALAKPIRFVTIEEMKTKNLDEEVFKAWTSGGKLSVDTDHEKEDRSNVSMVTCFSLTNQALDFQNVKRITKDRLDALKRRVAFFAARSRFVDAHKLEEEKAAGEVNVFVKNTDLKNLFAKDVEYHRAFAWIMMEQWRKLAATGWKKPDMRRLDEALEEHMDENMVADPLQMWLRDHYQPDVNGKVALDELLRERDDQNLTKANMREAVCAVFGRVVDGQPMYQKDRMVRNYRGVVRIARKVVCQIQPQ